MPYRRLPNTDQARVRALKAVCEMADKSDDLYEMPVDLKTLTAVRNFLPPVLFSGPIMACTVCTAFPGLSPSLA